MNRRTGVYLIAAWLLVAACECDDETPPSRSAQRREEPPPPTTGEGALPDMPAPEGTPVSAERLAAHAPDALSGFSARGDAEQQSTPLPNGGELPAVRRSYERDGAELHLEITDALHAPVMRGLVASQQGVSRKAAGVDFRGMRIAGQPAIAQWHAATRTASVNLLIGDRFMANVKVVPAASAEPAVTASSALPIAEIAALAPAGVDAGPPQHVPQRAAGSQRETPEP